MRLAAIGGVLALSSACGPRGAVLGVIECGPQGECPEGYYCEQGLCRPIPIDAATGDDANGDALLSDGSTDATSSECVGGDDRCLDGCATIDPDCATTCGDGECIGNAGELCANCQADCRTQDVVCGNGQCQAGEAPDCYADCGPSPWPWVTQENDLLVLINQRRMNGHACPNSQTTTAAPLTMGPAPLKALAREWVWEISHQEWVAETSCNGRTINDRAAQVMFSYEVNGRGYMSASAAVDDWFSHPVICPRLMSAGFTQLAPAVALDNLKAYLVLLR